MAVLQGIFYQIVLMGMRVSVVILAVFAARLLMRGLPKSYSYVLWTIVGFRLCCPVSFSSKWSIFNLHFWDALRNAGRFMAAKMRTGTDVQDAVLAVGKKIAPLAGRIQTEGAENTMGRGFLVSYAGGAASNPGEMTAGGLYAAESGGSLGKLLTGIGVGADTALWLEKVLPGIWLVGVLMLSAYAFISWMRCRKRVSHAVLLKENIYECDNLDSPFVAGIAAPKIYIPFRLGTRVQACILAHERCHIRRRDYLVKPFAFLLAALYWFHPLVWAAYYGMCRDMEMSCDERALAQLGTDAGQKSDYAMSLLAFSLKRRVGVMPLAFGEPDASRRIKNVLHFQKPRKALTVLTGILLAAFLAACAADGTKSQGLAGTENAGASDEKMPGNETDIAGTESGATDTDRITGDTENKTMVEADAEVSAGLERFATAFCERDTETICAMLTDEGVAAFEESGLLAMEGNDIAFGFSSPWPWDAARDYRIMAADGGSARILYYAWTSDPHVTVWESTLHYQIEDGAFLVTPEPVDILDSMCSSEEFYRAYPDGVIRGTRMDYSANGAGEALQKNAMPAGSDAYKGLFEPGTAAVKLLNLLDNENKVRVTESPGEGADLVQVNIEFLEFGNSVTVLMVRPWKNIWIPQDDAAVLGRNGMIPLENEDMEALEVKDIQEKLAEIASEKQGFEEELASVTAQKQVLENKEKSEDEQYYMSEFAGTGEELKNRAMELKLEIEQLQEYEKELQKIAEEKGGE